MLIKLLLVKLFIKTFNSAFNITLRKPNKIHTLPSPMLSLNRPILSRSSLLIV